MSRRYGPIFLSVLLAVVIAFGGVIYLADRSHTSNWWLYVTVVAGPLLVARLWAKVHLSRCDRGER